LGDLIRIALLNNKDVKFAGYRVPHPLEDTLEIKLQTTIKDPNEVFKHALGSLQKDILDLESEFTDTASHYTQ
jgi:DNA-directed RNA polymerase II subunit RPB11